MKLLLSDRLDFLVESLSHDLDQDGYPPLHPRTIVVPSLQLKSWLMLALAKRRAVVAGITIVSGEPKKNKIRRWGKIYSWLKRTGKIELELYREGKRCIELAGHLNDLFALYEKYGVRKAEGWQQECFAQTREEEKWEWKDPVYCFGCDFLPDALWEKFSSIYLFSPCVHFWEDLCTNWEKKKFPLEFQRYLAEAPLLLANWGKLGRETLKILDRFPAEIEERYSEEIEETTLCVLRKNILHFEQTPYPLDSSLRIFHTPSSRFREIEVLKQNVESLYQQGILFSQMLVLAPMIEPYVPLIELVFAEKIPYRIPSASTNKFPQLLSLIDAPFDEKVLLEFYESEKREKIARWLELGLDQVAENLVFASEEETNWADADLLEELLQKRSELLHDLQGGEKTWGEWALFLEKLIQKYQLPEFPCLQELKEASSDEKFPVDALFHLISRPHTEAVHPSYLHGVCFHSLQLGTIVPTRAIFLIGMDEGNFPRREKASSLDLLRGEKKFVPRSIATDRYGMLQLLFAAREHLYISYSQEEKSLLVQELMSELPGIKIETAQRLSVQSVSTDYFCIEYPFPPLPEGEVTLHVRDLSKLARHPWEFYLHKVLGIFLEKREIDSFAGLRTYQAKELLREKKVREEKLPPGCLGKCLEKEIGETAEKWREQLQEWNLTLQKYFLMKTCREKRRVTAHGIEVPPLVVQVTEKLVVHIVGELENVSERGWVTTGDEVGPEAWIGAHVSGGKEVFFLKKGKGELLEKIEENLRAFLVYYFRALAHLPPPKKSFFDDPVTDWFLARTSMPPEEKLKEKWSRPFCAKTAQNFF